MSDPVKKLNDELELLAERVLDLIDRGYSEEDATKLVLKTHDLSPAAQKELAVRGLTSEIEDDARKKRPN